MAHPEQTVPISRAGANRKAHHRGRIARAAIICAIAILIISPDSNSQTAFLCGEEYRVETQDGVVLQGRLQHGDNDSLSLWISGIGAHTIAIDDVTAAFHVQRKTGSGILAGAILGTLTGFAVAMIEHSANEPDDGWGLEDIGDRISKGVMITMAGTMVGCVVGGLLGHHAQKLGPVQLEAQPMCYFPSGEMAPLAVRLTVNF